MHERIWYIFTEWIIFRNSKSQLTFDISLFLSLSLFGFLRQDFSVALELVLELALVDQASLELTEISLHLPPKCWD